MSMNPSFSLEIGFVILAISLVTLFAYVLKSRRFLLLGTVWLAVTAGIAKNNLLIDFSSTPPRIFFLLIPALTVTIYLGLSKLGKRLSDLPLVFLVGYQTFRIPVELLIHQAVVEGVAPLQMSWNGMNFDILSGASALLLCFFVERVPKWVVLLWNTISLGLLAWVVGVAILSFPSAFQQLKPDNVWVAYFPFIWLPTVAVTGAFLGHIVVFRKLLKSYAE